MRLLKSEHEARFHNHPEHAREDVPMQPEQLCDYDIMMWRNPEQRYDIAGCDISAPLAIEPVRKNDIDAPRRDCNTRDRDFAKIRTQLIRTMI